MSLSLRSLVPATRLSLRTTPRLACSCRPAFVLSLSAPPYPFLSRSYAAKKSKGKRGTAVVQEEEEVVLPRGKGVKKGKGKFVEEDEVAEGVSFDLKALEKTMEDAVDRLRVGLKTVVGRVGRVSPGECDSMRWKGRDGADASLLPSQTCSTASRSRSMGSATLSPSSRPSLSRTARTSS